MMKTSLMKKITSLLAGAALMLATGSAMAIPLLGGESPDLQVALNNITIGPTPSVSSVNVQTDYLSYDSIWKVTATGGSIAAMLIEVAGNAGVNTFGIYDPFDTNNRLQLFAGAAGSGSQVLLTSYANGNFAANGTEVNFTSTLFGYYIGAPNDVFFSDTSKNDDGFDHMFAYQGKNIDTVQIANLAPGLWTKDEFVLAFEDLRGGGDQDYQDMVVMVESVTPVVPEPGTILLLGAGLLGLGIFGRKRMKV